MTSTGPNLRFRIARELAKRAHDLSKAAGIHLPSLIRSMVTFMRVENSSPDQQDSVRARFAAASNLDTYEPRYWAEMTPFLDAEVAIAMLHQTVADATTWLANTATEGKQAGAREEEVQRVTSERAEACSLLRKFDPEDGESVARVFERFRTSHDKLTAAAPNQIGQLQLSKDELDAIYEHRIRPDVLSWGTASSSPAAVLVVGQAGAAVLSTAARLRRQITLETGEMVVLSDDRLRPYHPAWRTGQGGEPLHAGSVHSDIDYWFERIVNDAGRMGMHLQIAMEPRNPLTVHRMAAALRDGGYTVQAVFVVTHSDDSALDATAQFERVRALGLPSRFVLEKEHDMGLFNFRLAVGVVEQYRSVDELQLVSSDAREHHGNSLLHGEWHRPPTARTALDALQKRTRSPKELVRVALQWETLAQRLTSDSSLPRQVKRQTQAWRNKALKRCEAFEEAAGLLRLAREGAAFRAMDRFDFERQHPHLEYATEEMGAAVIEAEKYDAKESARFLASARKNIAQRIERGDMARIAERQEKMRSAARK